MIRCEEDMRGNGEGGYRPPKLMLVDWNFRQKVLLLAMKGAIRAYMYVHTYIGNFTRGSTETTSLID